MLCQHQDHWSDRFSMRSCPERASILAFFAPPSSPQRRKPSYAALLRIRGNYFRPYLGIPRVYHRGAAYQWKFSYYFETQSVFDPPDTIFKDNDACLILSIKFSARGDVNKRLSQKQSGTGCVTKWWDWMKKGARYSVCLKRKANSPPGDKQIRFDSPPTLPSKAPLSVPRTKKGTFPEKKIRSRAIF